MRGASAHWSARAIFKPFAGLPLEFLYDRQDWAPANLDERFRRAFAKRMNDEVIPQFQEYAGACDPEDEFELCFHAEWPERSGQVLVARGKPTYGYFYVGVSLVARGTEPPIFLPPGYKTPEQIKEIQARLRAQSAAYHADQKAAREADKAYRASKRRR